MQGAPMRTIHLTWLSTAALLLAACGGSSDADVDAGPGGPDADADTTLRVVSPDIEIAPGEEITYCYYFDMPNDAEVGVRRWTSTMTPGSHHLIVFLAGSGAPAAGTLVPDCDGFGLGDEWMYSAQTPENEAVMPDGVGMPIGAGRRAFVQMHYLTASDVTLDAHVEVTAEVYPAGTAYTRAAAYITYSQGFSIPANSMGQAGDTCAVPADAKFFAMSTHSHHYSMQTDVFDGATNILTSTSWEHPTVETWDDDPYFSFASGELTYACEYFNDTASTVYEGSSAQLNEMCMAVGYFFPAPNGPRLCVNGFVLP
ncbi:MAG: hypothetical protein R2939_09020 [Kofleriaceae bacterium]